MKNLIFKLYSDIKEFLNKEEIKHEIRCFPILFLMKMNDREIEKKFYIYFH